MSDGDGLRPKKEITVKIFQNGVFHITGVLHESYDRDVVKTLHDSIVASCPDAILEGTWDMSTRRVVLMNYKTKLIDVTNLSREQLHANIRKQGYKTNYEPAVYPAVKIYFEDTKWIAKVFRTGNIILTGMTTETECEQLTQKLKTALSV
jgi:TATA-box binding protein (TBP) (component of TFIID and TFIIIB)